MTGITRVTIWVIRVINLLSTSPDPPSSCSAWGLGVQGLGLKAFQSRWVNGFVSGISAEGFNGLGGKVIEYKLHGSKDLKTF